MSSVQEIGYRQQATGNREEVEEALQCSSCVIDEEEETYVLPERLWTREEYYRAAEAGVFKQYERLELVDGRVIRKVSPQSRPHAMSVNLTAYVLEQAFREDYHITREQPIVLSEKNEPEPDLAVVRGTPRDYLDHPTPKDIVLIVEVSESFLALDQRYKSALYAWGGIQEYWVINLKNRTLEVRREPREEPGTPFGHSYKHTGLYSEAESVTPLAAPDAVIKVSDLLPNPPINQE